MQRPSTGPDDPSIALGNGRWAVTSRGCHPDPWQHGRVTQTPPPSANQPAESAPDLTGQRIVIVGPDGQPIGEVVQAGDSGDEDSARSITDLVEQPAKVMRIGSMVKQLLDEVKAAPLDEAARTRLREIHARSLKELEDGLAPELVEELSRLALPFSDDSVPSESELRIAQAQLVGWLEGLFHGIQTALFAQQMAARAQFDEMRRRAGGQPMLPAGMLPMEQENGTDLPDASRRPTTGPYL